MNQIKTIGRKFQKTISPFTGLCEQCSNRVGQVWKLDHIDSPFLIIDNFRLSVSFQSFIWHPVIWLHNGRNQELNESVSRIWEKNPHITRIV